MTARYKDGRLILEAREHIRQELGKKSYYPRPATDSHFVDYPYLIYIDIRGTLTAYSKPRNLFIFHADVTHSVWEWLEGRISKAVAVRCIETTYRHLINSNTERSH